MRRFWLRPLSLLQPLADRLFVPASPPCACDASNDPDEPCGACHAMEREFPGAETRRGPLLRCRLSDVLPAEPS